MERELIKIATTLFDTEEKWNSYLELAKLQQKIVNEWESLLTYAIHNMELSPEWKVYNDGMGFRWYLERFGENSLCVCLENEKLSLWADQELFDIDKLRLNIVKTEYDILYNAFLVRQDGAGGYLFFEKGRFEFDSIHNNKFDWNHLAWFAGNKTDEFVEQLKRKLKPFFDATDLMIKLNEMAMIP